MKSILPYIITFVLGAVSVILLQKGCAGHTVGDNSKDSTFYWKNKYGQEIATLRKPVEDLTTINKALLDTIAVLHNTPPQKIKEYVIVTVHGSDTLGPKQPPEIRYDTVKVGCPPVPISFRQIFGNNYYYADVNLSRIPDSSRLYLQTFDTLYTSWKDTTMGGLFNRKRYLQLDISNANPYNHITGIHAYRAPDQPVKQWNVSLSLGYGWLWGQPRPAPFAGLTIGKTLFRF